MSSDAPLTLRELRARGQCRDMDPDIFTGDDEVAQQIGKKICETRCAVKEQCLEYAFATKQSWGVWGGTTAADRKNLLKIKHRVHCPGCRSLDVEAVGKTEVCLKCGLSWFV